MYDNKTNSPRMEIRAEILRSLMSTFVKCNGSMKQHEVYENKLQF